MPLLIEINLVSEEQSYKRDLLRLHGTGYVKMIFTIFSEILILYISASIL